MINKAKQILKVISIRRKYKKIGTTLHTINIKNSTKLGRNCLISKRVILEDNVEIGDYTYLNSGRYWITVETNVKIGKFCSIAPGVHIGAGNHEYKYVTTHPILFDRYYENKLNLKNNMQKVNGLKDKECITTIGNDVWIGLNAIIKRGINIGNGAVIAAGSVVTKDVPDYAIVGGNPARVIKYRTDEDNIQFLKENESQAWWNYEETKLADNLDKLYDFEDYIKFIKENNREQ